MEGGSLARSGEIERIREGQRWRYMRREEDRGGQSERRGVEKRGQARLPTRD